MNSGAPQEGDVVRLICSSATSGKAHVVGTSRLPCEECGTPVWVAPSGMQIKNERNATIVCWTCGLQSLMEDEQPVIGGLTDAQIRELRDYQRRNVL